MKFKLFDYYGKHFMTYTLFGARFVYEHKLQQEQKNNLTDSEMSLAVKASYSGAFSLGAFYVTS